ncbi:beta-ketoacyl-ACP synthase III [Floccifex sp.]|uniref:beta-ketoacyl-ACP synthase III n=1 Tax=Floccifex sp. TaxID=2815810 RepID=UPI003F00FF8D
MENVKIIGCGYAQLNKKVKNTDLEKVVDTSDEWIQQRTGIQSRYINESQSTAQIAYQASIAAIQNAQIDVQDIDCIILASTTPDQITPSTACIVQEKLGLNQSQCTAFDINAACSGFVYALTIAKNLLEDYDTILVIGAETLSRIVDWNDRNTCVLFGDGAGACIVRKSEKGKMISYTKSKGDIHHTLHCDFDKKLEMNGKEVFRYAIEAMPTAIEQVLKKAHVSISDIDLIIPHQANIRILQHVSKKMNISLDRFFINLNEFGNTSSASIAIALAQAKEQGKLKEGSKIVLTGFGSGFTSGALYIEWTNV